MQLKELVTGICTRGGYCLSSRLSLELREGISEDEAFVPSLVKDRTERESFRQSGREDVDRNWL